MLGARVFSAARRASSPPTVIQNPCCSSRLYDATFDAQRWMHALSGDNGASPARSNGSDSPTARDKLDTSSWKTVDSRAFGVHKCSISFPTWKVLEVLHKKGFDAYLVGGCVRDLLLRRTPKDFDVITTASLKEVKQNFCRSRVIGRRFPICHVCIGKSIVEVSSFRTCSKNAQETKTSFVPTIPHNLNDKDAGLWRNSMRRDFTVNGLFYDPYVNIIHDYVNGLRDLRTLKIRTVIPARASFKEDCARILRALRISARLGLRFSKETAVAIKDLSPSIRTLDKSRLMMELNFMMAYGAAVPSICLLQKFKVLDILLPIHAAYLANRSAIHYNHSSNMLMKLLANLDRLLCADRPCDCVLWLGLLAFHMALLEHPQDTLVVWAFSSFLWHGTCSKALKIARENARLDVSFIPEISVISSIKSDEDLVEEAEHLASLAKSSINTFACEAALQQALARYQDSPPSAVILISKKMKETVARLFNFPKASPSNRERTICTLNYQLLKEGNLDESRYVLGKVIMDTLSGDPAVVENKKQALSALFM